MKYLTLVITSGLALSGCATTENMPIVFGQSQTVGIAIGGSTTEQGAEFTLGYKDKNFAVVPVTVKQKDGNSTTLQGIVSDGKTSGTDAFSVLGQFDVSSSTNSANAGLGKFFATGSAAAKLADGFADKLGKKPGSDSAQTPAAGPPQSPELQN
jgi:hypothetical protein